ncbi:unnamed protein product [Thelazia callipaeda]|uniref:DNA-directed RNA polymerase n=1 Tax=Thelazia callipaeda TaxID=103827 RepID=A0A0N5CKA8_THECL|nr:unnamed protein product [Thelazia callipaeda]
MVFQYLINNKRCWGYEPNCDRSNSYSFQKIKCLETDYWNPGTSESVLDIYKKQGDFEKLKEILNTIKPICSSNSAEGSFLECSDHLRFCRARNIYFNLENLNAQTSKRYRNDVIREGEVGGKCDLKFDRKLLLSRLDEKSYLQSWAHELENFVSYSGFRIDKEHCDVIFENPTVLIKLDASVSMYHHFCDFINLYASQHVNGSIDMNIDIMWWDTWLGGFVDSLFGETWKAFTINKPYELINFDKKTVCFRNVMFSMLARQRFGLYYNIPLVDGCRGSGLFHAFSQHILNRLSIRQHGPILDKVRVTLLSRSTPFRRITNEDEVSFAFFYIFVVYF